MIIEALLSAQEQRAGVYLGGRALEEIVAEGTDLIGKRLLVVNQERFLGTLDSGDRVFVRIDVIVEN